MTLAALAVPIRASGLRLVYLDSSERSRGHFAAARPNNLWMGRCWAAPVAVATALKVRHHPSRCSRLRRSRRWALSTTVLKDVSEAEVTERRKLQELVSKWRADDSEAWLSLALTAGLYLSSLALVHLSGGHWSSIIFLAFALVRAFIVFHDAAHSSFFEKPEHNKSLGQVLQFFINYSLEEWNAVHNSHHAHFGDNTIRDSSLTIWFSEQELDNAAWYLRLVHRIIRDPIFFYPLAGLFVFFLNKPQQHWPYRTVVPFLVWYGLGMQTLCAYLLAAWLGGSLGVACFHLQHHCNSPYRVPDDSSRTHLDAAILGSTRIPLAWPLSVFSFGIEYHHIHHFDIRVPGYRLERCDAEGEEPCDALRGFRHRSSYRSLLAFCKSPIRLQTSGLV
ncbi:unnamed protein product [Durusdinium trenchii]|uniref:Fatty acid desaturase domain-containing protein n=2 Tax=Durusdinium trenchii TaxID=1381693 RepID=A0ABP0RZU1_9DINO